MRTIALLVLLLAALPGCAAMMESTGRTCRPIIVVAVENPYDLQIEAWDSKTQGAYPGVAITVLDTKGQFGSRSVTDFTGWTGLLATPANAQVVQIIIEWYDRDGFSHSYQRGVWLQHQVVTRERVWVDSTPPR